MILEGIITTLSADNELNIAPMGPHFKDGDNQFELRPFETSITYRNLCSNPFGVLHISDDVLLFARSAINELHEPPSTRPASKVPGFVIENSCRWFEFSGSQIASAGPRKLFHCSIAATGSEKPFFGFNRAKHAVLEATIMATRIDFIPIEEIQQQFLQFATIVEKTGGAAEREAFDLLNSYVNRPL